MDKNLFLRREPITDTREIPSSLLLVDQLVDFANLRRFLGDKGKLKIASIWNPMIFLDINVPSITHILQQAFDKEISTAKDTLPCPRVIISASNRKNGGSRKVKGFKNLNPKAIWIVEDPPSLLGQKSQVEVVEVPKAKTSISFTLLEFIPTYPIYFFIIVPTSSPKLTLNGFNQFANSFGK